MEYHLDDPSDSTCGLIWRLVLETLINHNQPNVVCSLLPTPYSLLPTPYFVTIVTTPPCDKHW